MPHVLFYEAGRAPSGRSLRELTTLQRAGYDVTVAHGPAAADAVAALGFGSCLLPEPDGNPFRSRLDPWLAELAQRRDALTAEIEQLKGSAAAGPRGQSARARAAALTRERAAVAARMRAIYAIRRTPTPLTAGAHFGDLARLEPQWHRAAQAMSEVAADLLWAADLDALPAVVWAREAMVTKPPIIFDSHELMTGLDYLPDIYRVGWRQVSERFVPLADVVVTVCEPIAQALREESGARRTVVIPNYAVPAADPGEPAADLRTQLGLSAEVPLVVHIGNIRANRNPGVGVDLAEHFPGLHVAFVGAGDDQVLAELRQRAAERGVADRVHVVAPVPPERLTTFVSSADMSLIVLRPDLSRNHRLAMPNKLFDSLAAGVPVLSAKGLLATEFVLAEGLGRAFDPQIPGDVAAAARALLADPEPTKRARARAGDFVWTRVEPVLLNLVDDLLRQHAATKAASA